jgi:hypothetical protein
MRDPFARATKSILAVLGKDALLRGAPAGKVNIEHGVELFERNGDGEAVFTRSVATIDATYSPKQGDTLARFTDDTYVVPIDSYKLGRLVQDTGFTRRYVAVPE